MYKSIFRPVFFWFSPESVHHFVAGSLKIVFKIPFTGWLVNKFTQVNDPRLEREVFGLQFKNPVGIAAGFDKQAEIYNELSNLGFGFIEIGTITPKGQTGNPQPRLFRLLRDKALINRMGFNNGGVDDAIKNLKKRKTKVIVGGNIGKNTLTPNTEAINDYVFCFEQLFDFVDYFVVNVSCPNVTHLRELQDQESLIQILGKIQQTNLAKPRPKPIL
jgi:dihydroorotate dehydrogenase